MAAVYYAIQLENQRRRKSHSRPRYFRDRTNVLEIYDDQALIRDYRFPRHVIHEIIEMCSSMGRSTNRNHALPVHIQVLAGLRFFARGVFQDDGKDIIGISQPSYCRIIHRMAEVLCMNARSYIKFPTTEEEIARVKQGFYSKFGFPNMLGVIDGSHVFIQAPSGKDIEPLFVCRKHGHSINVQVVFDPECMFLDIVAKWPGATHDSFIWQNCGLRKQLEAHPPNGWLVGDSGYSLEPWLMTMYERCPTQSHKDYNQALRKTRSIVERGLGLYKGAFRRLDVSGGAMIYKPAKVCKIITACAVLHNMRRRLKLPEDEAFEIHPDLFEDSNERAPEGALYQLGSAIRDSIRTNFFS